MPTETFNRESLANWYAEQHLKTDPGITKVIYVPSGASDREIRFLEINTLVFDDRMNHQLVPIDFGVNMGQESHHKLFVIDLTPNQWEQIQQGKLSLPEGWSLDSMVEYHEQPDPTTMALTMSCMN